jgi:hypothetical protein
MTKLTSNKLTTGRLKKNYVVINAIGFAGRIETRAIHQQSTN